MGWRINDIIEGGELIDDYIKPVYSESIEFSGSSVVDSACLKQGANEVWFTYNQLEQLYKILHAKRYAGWEVKD